MTDPLTPLTTPSEAAEEQLAYSTITRCRACTSTDLEVVLDLGRPCLSDFLKGEGTPLPPRVPLRLAHCGACGLVQLMETTEPDLLYREFWYRSGTNQTMAAALHRIAALPEEYGIKRGRWLDIGANDGTLLSFVATPARGGGFYRVGVEPAINLRRDLVPHCELCLTDYYGPHSAPLHSCSVITSAAMFYDVADPHAFVTSIRDHLDPKGIWVNQLSYTPEMVKALAFDNVCHEHLMYYTLTTLQSIYSQHGLRIIDVRLNPVNGGSMCVVAAHEASDYEQQLEVDTLLFAEATIDREYYREFGRKVELWAEAAREKLKKWEGKRVHVYGASTKGSTLLQYLGVGAGLLPYAADRNPEKWGLLTSGTWIKIIAEEDSRAMHPDAYFVLPWAFRAEFVDRESQYLANGGTLIFPLPKWEEVRG